MPDFQREEVWTETKKRLLIDSILRGWHLPKFYFRKVDDGAFECVDGQQRLTAIWEFFDCPELVRTAAMTRATSVVETGEVFPRPNGSSMPLRSRTVSGGTQRCCPIIVSTHHGANWKPSFEEQTAQGSPDCTDFTGCPGYQDWTVCGDASFLPFAQQDAAGD
jgi:hypothetical protein